MYVCMYICVCNPLEEKGGGGEGEGGERKEKDESQTRNAIFPLGSKGYKCEKCFFGTRVPCSVESLQRHSHCAKEALFTLVSFGP